MKKIILMGAMALSVLAAGAQDFKATLQKTVNAFDTTNDPGKKLALSNKLTLIAKKWPDEWAGHYYASWSKVVMAFMETEGSKKDAYLDEADKEREETVTLLKKENDETYVLGAMAANARIGVDPMSRWQKYGQIFRTDLESAKEINPDNPRMYYLEGTNKMFTPKAYGGGKKAALPYFEKAEGLFAKENDGDITKPYWGKIHNTMFLKQCRAGDSE